MIGEKHSLFNEFPQSLLIIEMLINHDDKFAADNKIYNALDTKIRKLELNNSPIDDAAMLQLKAERAQLKDSLYERIMQATK